MRIRLILPLLASFCVPAVAQVTVDPRALEPLKPAPAHVAPKAVTKPKAPAAKPAPAKTALPTVSSSGTTVRTSPTAAAQPAIPTSPPPPIYMPPPIVVPTRATQPTPLPTVTADAPGRTTALEGGLRVLFGSNHAELNPAMESAIRGLVRPVSVTDGSSFTITSYAAGTPEDPSTARRLSLSRALAVRSVLINQGIASIRIYVRALGPTSAGFADGPADRADVVATSNSVAPPAASPVSVPAKSN